MPRKGAGRRYPFATTDARPHDHTMCPVTGTIATAARAGDEPWGTEHPMPLMPVDEETIERIRHQLFAAQRCRKLALEHGDLSVSIRYRRAVTKCSSSCTADDPCHLQDKPPVRLEGGYQLVVRVWPKGQGRQKITRDAEAGKPLPYNVMASQ